MTYSLEVKVSFCTQGNWSVKLFKSNAQVRKTTERHHLPTNLFARLSFSHDKSAKLVIYKHAQNTQPINLTIFKSIPKNPTDFHPQSA